MIPRMSENATSGTAVLARIDARIDELKSLGIKVSDRSLSLKSTGSPDTIRSIRRNLANGSQRHISTHVVQQLSKGLNCSVLWLLTGDDREEMDDTIPADLEENAPHRRSHIESDEIAIDVKSGTAGQSRMVRLVGYVGAGSEAHFYALADEDYEMVDAPEGASDQTVAAEIKGKSFGPLMDGWLVYYDDVRSPITEDLYGEICVVGLADDRILIKQVSRERDGSLSLLSNSNEPPIRDAEIEWAARVTDMKRRRR